MNNLIGRGVFHSERLSCKRDTGSSHHSEKFFCGILLFLQLDGNGVLPVLLPYKKGDEKITLEMDLCRYVGINPVFSAFGAKYFDYQSLPERKVFRKYIGMNIILSTFSSAVRSFGILHINMF
jgi:hypothetical protein